MNAPQTPTGGPWPPEAGVRALHAQGPSALAEVLGDLGFLLESVATEPKDLFAAEDRSSAEYKRVLDALHVVRSAIDALEARTVVAFRETVVRDHLRAARDEVGHDDSALPPLERIIRQADSVAAKDVSLATRRSPSAAGSSLRSAQRLVRSMPRMLSALASGKVTAAIAHGTASSLDPLGDEQRVLVDAALDQQRPRMDGAGVRAWRRAAQQAVGELDPDGAAWRHRRARRERHVTLTPGEHGMATLSARLPAMDAVLVRKRLSLEAERRRALGAREGHGSLMADLLVDTLLGRGEEMEPVTLDIGVMITDRALLLPQCGDPAQIEGYGAVPAESVREELHRALAEPDAGARDRYGPDGPQIRAVLRRLYTHPTTGELVAAESMARHFPASMKRFLRWRDTTCRSPFCDAPVRQDDHIVPVAEGGWTSLANGQGLCADCNSRKEQDTASVTIETETENGSHAVRWTGHGGDTVTSSASRIAPMFVWTAERMERQDEPDVGGPEAGEPEPRPDFGGVQACAEPGHRGISCRIPEDETASAPLRQPRTMMVRSCGAGRDHVASGETFRVLRPRSSATRRLGSGWRAPWPLRDRRPADGAASRPPRGHRGRCAALAQIVAPVGVPGALPGDVSGAPPGTPPSAPPVGGGAVRDRVGRGPAPPGVAGTSET